MNKACWTVVWEGVGGVWDTGVGGWAPLFFLFKGAWIL